MGAGKVAPAPVIGTPLKPPLALLLLTHAAPMSATTMAAPTATGHFLRFISFPPRSSVVRLEVHPDGRMCSSGRASRPGRCKEPRIPTREAALPQHGRSG